VVAEKLIERSNFATVDAARAEARTHFGSFIGTTEVVPLLRSILELRLGDFFRSHGRPAYLFWAAQAFFFERRGGM
jgi:hypothetical protein